MKRITLGVLFALATLCTNAQNDKITFKNGNFIIGEIKEMSRGVLKVETDYSDSDFAIEWEGIQEIQSEMFYLFNLSDGTRLNGSFSTTPDGKIKIVDEEEGTHIINPDEVVYIKSVKTDFWSKLSASIDIGYSYTKARNAQQFDARSQLGYLTDHWSANASYDAVYTSQDSTEDIRRTDAALGYNYFLKYGWFLLAQANFLSNTELSLTLRTTGKLGAGYYAIQTNAAYWNFNMGLAVLNEEYSNGDPTTNSLEGFVGSELNLYDIGDLNLITSVTAYPGITESGRFRCDFTFDLKYDLPRDFYVKLGTTVNYDNHPATDASEVDYVVQAGFGWEL